MRTGVFRVVQAAGAPTRGDGGGAGPAALGRSGDPWRSESPSCDSDPGRPAARSGRGPRLAADLEIRGEGMRACLRGGKGRYMTLASRRIRSVVSSCAHMRASADKARRSSRPGDRRCLPIRRRSAPFPGSARRASQPISQGAQSHTTPPQQQPQPQQQQPLFGLRFPGPHGGRLSRSAKALSLIQRRGGGGGGGGSSSSSRCSVMMNFSSVPGRWAGRPVREDCARRNVNEGVYGPSCPKGLEMIYKAYLEPWPGQAAVT